MWSRLVALGLPFYKQSQARGRALAGLGVLVALLLAVNGMNVVNSYVGRDFMSALAERRASRFFTFAGVLAGVFAVSTVTEVLSRYAEQWLGLVWREWLTRRLLDRYLAGRAYLRLADRHDIDNPDERISQDVKTFTATTLSILVMLFNGFVTLVAISWVHHPLAVRHRPGLRGHRLGRDSPAGAPTGHPQQPAAPEGSRLPLRPGPAAGARPGRRAGGRRGGAEKPPGPPSGPPGAQLPRGHPRGPERGVLHHRVQEPAPDHPGGFRGPPLH
jgi:hypothetical protein